MGGGKTQESLIEVTDEETHLEGMWQVILFNDDHNEIPHVIESLRRVFGHPEPLARKIMWEAHRRGKAVAEVEEREKAQLHKDQLQSYGLTAAIEPVAP